jgi:hypothetical protein
VTRLPKGKGLLSTSAGSAEWNYPGQASKLLEIRPLKTTWVTIEDIEMENCLGKAKFTSAEGCAGTWAHQAQGEAIGPHFIPDAQVPAPLLALVGFRCTFCL